MKHVVKSKEVAHLWAHQAQSDARASHFYFEGDVIYSYGGHFPIAKHVKTKAGKPAILFTTQTHSNTTTRHCRYVRQAIPPGALVFNVDLRHASVEPSLVDLKDYQDAIDAMLRKASTARSNAPHYTAQAARLVEEANAFSKAFALRRKFKMPGDLAGIRAAVKAEAKHKLAEEKRRNIARQAEQEEKLNVWLGNPASRVVYVPGTSYLRRMNDEVETTFGAHVPLDHVKAVLPLVLRLLAEGKTYAANGHTIHIGHYKLDAIEADGTAVVGCHRFSRAEVERFAATLT